MLAASAPLVFDLAPPGALGVYRSPVFRIVVSCRRSILAVSGPYCSIYGAWGLSALRFPERGILDFGRCGILAASPLIFDLGPPCAIGVYPPPRFPKKGVFWLVWHSDHISPIFSDLWHPCTLGSIAQWVSDDPLLHGRFPVLMGPLPQRYRKGKAFSKRAKHFPVGGPMPKHFHVCRNVFRLLGHCENIPQ